MRRNAMTLAMRLALGFLCLVLLLVAVAAFNGHALRTMGVQMRQIVEENNPKSSTAYRMLSHIESLAVQVRSITLLTDAKEIEAEYSALKSTLAEYAKDEAELQQRLQATGASAQEEALLAAIRAAAQRTVPLLEKAARQGREGASLEATMTLMQGVRPHETEWRRKTVELVALEERLNQDSYAAAAASQRRAVWVAGLLVVLAAGAGLLLAWQTTRSVRQPIAQAMAVAERIAEGDLSTPVAPGSGDEIGRLVTAIARMQDRLRELVGAIRQSVQSIQTASAEVAIGNQDLSRRTELAASNLQYTASSMEQLTGTVQQSADAAAQASGLAESASSVASRGGTVVSQVVATMQQINTSSKKIADIIGVIDGIAFQTNILALNAAVEAARAGEQGRGFAVVAGEVRQLAQRAAEAAREIKALIGASVDKVETGARLVQDAGTTMDEIVASVRRVTDTISRITAVSGQQSSGLAQINTAVAQVDQMTQQNAALVEQSAAAAESLKDQANKLNALIETFRLP